MKTLQEKKIKKLKERLKREIGNSKAMNEDVNERSWGTQTGILITANEAKMFINLLTALDKEIEQGEEVTDGELDEFIYDIKHMQGLYQNQRYTQAEEWKNKLTERLDDVMREQIKKEKGKTL